MTDTTKRMLEEIAAFRQELETREKTDRKKITEEEFIFLLSAPASCRMIPGIEINMGYEEMYYCKTEEDKVAARDFLKKRYGITDMDSLQEACNNFYDVHKEYEQFQSFWDGIPLFDVEQLSVGGRNSFTLSKEYAELFCSFVGRKGFLAWDCNERIAMARRACACGLITEDDFWAFSNLLAKRASTYFSSWEEYAVSCLCGGLYFMFREQEFDEDKVLNYYDITRRIMAHLFDAGSAWDRNDWYVYPSKKWAIPAYEMKELLINWQGATGCFITDRITVDGCKVGYMYREEPDNDWDSGWRFTAGDEPDEYMDNPDNSGIYTLNTACNSDPDIIPLLNAPCGTAYYRDENGNLTEYPVYPFS